MNEAIFTIIGTILGYIISYLTTNKMIKSEKEKTKMMIKNENEKWQKEKRLEYLYLIREKLKIEYSSYQKKVKLEDDDLKLKDDLIESLIEIGLRKPKEFIDIMINPINANTEEERDTLIFDMRLRLMQLFENEIRIIDNEIKKSQDINLMI